MSIFSNVEIITNEIKITNHQMPAGEFELIPTFSRKTGRLTDDKYFTELSVTISNTEEHPFPIDLYVCMTAAFSADNIPSEDIDNFLKIDGAAVLYPYLRSLISSIATSALMPPIILPVIDMETLFAEKDSQS